MEVYPLLRQYRKTTSKWIKLSEENKEKFDAPGLGNDLLDITPKYQKQKQNETKDKKCQISLHCGKKFLLKRWQSVVMFQIIHLIGV